MTIEVPTEGALRGAAALRSLVEAVVAADEHDEADWIEWKGPLDVATKDGCFHIARAVLGLANREPDRAQLTVEGLGYVVVGAEPGTLHGLTTIDPAKLSQLIEPYLGGADGPAWTPTYIEVGTAMVLVVTVEPPKPGDPMRLLRREFGKYREGVVFVRKHGRTEVADAADMDALQRRLLASGGQRGANLAVRAIGDVPLSWYDPATWPQVVEAWADEEQSRVVEAGRSVDRARRAERSKASRDAQTAGGILGGFALPSAAMLEQISQMGSAATFGFAHPDQRTLNQYEDEVAGWRQELVDAAPKCLPGRYVRAGHGVIRLEVENLGSRFLPDVEVEAIFGDETAKGYDERPKWVEYPAPPHPFGKAQPGFDYGSILGAASFVPPIAAVESLGRRTWVEDGSVKVRWHVGDVRQHGKDRSDEVYIFVAGRPPGGVLQGSWNATVPDVEGVLTGTFEIPVAEEPVDMGALLRLRRKRD